VNPLCVWVIYEKPRDFPNHFVVRRQWAVGKNHIEVDRECHLTRTLEEARKLIPLGLYRFPRDPSDDPFIVESWL
jgi:hypothetical protein